MSFALKSPSKQNGRSSKDHADGALLLGRKRISSSGSPEIQFRPEFAYETYELNASFSASSPISPSKTNGNFFSVHQAIRANKMESVRRYSEKGHDMDVVDGAGFTALHYASSANNTEAMSLLLDCRANVNYQGQQLLTPLHMAVRYNSFEAVKTLIEYNADPSIENTDGATPLHFAARRGCVPSSRVLLSNKLSSVNCPDNSGMTPFHLACVSGSLKLCEMFLEQEANICARTLEQKSPLHLAALHGNEKIVELLITQANDIFGIPHWYINKPDFEGNTPLHLACQKGHVETAKCLLGFGADVMDGENQWDIHSPLHLAATNGHMTVVELLITHNAPVDCRDEFQRTPLHRAAEFDRDDVVKYLLKMGADIEARDSAYRTAFLCAVKRGRARTAELLLESGADMKSRDDSLRTCIHLAVQYEREDTLRMLLNRDQDELINEKDKDLETPLHYAAKIGSNKILQLLLMKKCAVTRNVFERSPLHEAAEKGHVSCVEVLCSTYPGHINDKDERGLTALHLAARERFRETCSVLLHMGAHIMIRDINRWTPLHHSAFGGCLFSTRALLDHHSTQPMKAKDEDGNTPLHIAAECGHVNIVKMMLSRGADISVVNKEKKTCLDVAIESGKEKVAEVFIGNQKWKDILKCKGNSEPNPMAQLIRKMPKLAEEVMNKCITYSDLPQSDPEYSVTFDFSLLTSDEASENQATRGKFFFGPATMVEAEREDLLVHPLCQALLQWKWIILGKPVFWCNFLTYLIFVCLFTVFTLTERAKQHVFDSSSSNATKEDRKIFENRNAFSNGVPVLIALFICIHIAKEIYQITVQNWRYFTHFTNLTEWCCYITALCYVAPFLIGRNIYDLSLWPLATVVILLSYISLTLFLRRFSYFGIYISMFIEVAKTFLRVIFIFTPMIVSFSLAFFLLLKEQGPFNTVLWSFVKTAIMMLGEIDYTDIIVEAKDQFSDESGAPLAPIPEFSATLVLLFCIMVSVLLMNLLVGLAVGDIDSIQRDANMTRLAMQVEFVTDIDQRFPHFLKKYFLKSVLVVKPNRRKKLQYWFGMDHNLFRKPDSFMEENNVDDAKEGESEDSEVIAEVARQRDQIRLLQNAVEDQSRILREISHQLKKAEAE